MSALGPEVKRGEARQGARSAPSPPQLYPQHSSNDGSPLVLLGGFRGGNISLRGGCPLGMINSI